MTVAANLVSYVLENDNLTLNAGEEKLILLLV